MRTPIRLMPWLLAAGLLVATPGLAPAAGQAVPRDGYPPTRVDPYPGDPRYPDGRYPNRGDARRGWGYRDVAFNNGFEDGYREGIDDGRDRDRYDPIGEKRYRKGDHGYDRRYGPKDYYQQEYRQGFRAGYDRGYREGRYYDRRDGRGRWGPWPW